ncbi:MAG: malto-oligosyltrehalose trehalohydrolase [Acidobacteriia bacterium]|nr:malto-oligosyltrehalose trehalohydrolase [Terriglobia bacterium]
MTTFSVWAPAAGHLEVEIAGQRYPMSRENADAANGQSSGWWSADVPDVAGGIDYGFRLDDGDLLPDPRSPRQPFGIKGPSRTYDHAAFPWADQRWRGGALHGSVIYELHVGTFTRAGTWAAASAELPFLAELGVTTIELMPVAEFAGGRNWGYDGVNLFAPAHVYGTPDDLRRFVDRAHQLGLAVILDVVYNHLGPSGNTLGSFAPAYFRQDRANDWGEAINFASPPVREFYLENAASWISEFHLDGLRLDATHAIHDGSEEHILAAIARRARAAAPERRVWLVAENESQDTELLRRFGLDAMWNDDFHHAARVTATGVIDGYLHGYRGTAHELVAAIRHGFLYQGQIYAWQRNPRGTSTRGLQRAQFVHFLENHDQAANFGFGERLVELTDPARFRALTALLLLSPSVPMLFQGQETGSRRPWQFFCDHEGDLAPAVRRGRAAFMSQFERLATAEAQAWLAEHADPGALASFTACILDPAERDFARPVVALHRDLLRLRRDDPAFTMAAPDALDAAALDAGAFVVRYRGETHLADRLLLVNLGSTFHGAGVAEPLIAPPAGTGWRLAWSSEDPRYGGHGTPPPFTRARLAIPAHAALVCVPDPAAVLRGDPPPADDNVAAEP